MWRILTIVLLALFPALLTAQKKADSVYYVDMRMTGVYQGNSLYVQNPYYNQQEKFCIDYIAVNKKKLNLNYRLSALKINFEGVSMFSPVSIDVRHMAQCQPKIVNPLAINYHSNFKYIKLLLNDTTLYWETKGDQIEGVYTVEQLNYDYWQEVAQVESKGQFDGASYEYPPSLMAGPNKFRIKYSLPSGRYLYSEEVEYTYYKEPITFHIASNRMIFSAVTEYEIQNAKGNTVVQGEGKEIPIRFLRPGEYTLVFDGGRAEVFSKK
ncbi:MAG: hypothetical protein RJQ09_16625 [Cyclobacteriaceae bacterium]